MISPSVPIDDVSTAPLRAIRISFLIPLYNGLELTRACLRTLQETVDLVPHEVILINDASTDGTAEFLDCIAGRPGKPMGGDERATFDVQSSMFDVRCFRKSITNLRILHNPQRSSYAASINRGVALARGEMLCLLNNDLVFRPGWLPPMLRAFEQFPNAGIVGNIQIDPRTGSYNHMGIIFNDAARPLHFGEHFPFRPFHGLTEWKAVTSACWLVRKSAFVAAGGYNEAYRNAGYEDTELCLALNKLGYRHYVANDSIIEHVVNSSEGRLQFESENARYFLQRWRDYILAQRTPRDRRLEAVNYLLRCLGQPSRFRFGKFSRAILTLLKCGH
jgi:GT2 family glycosyltransferase